MNLDKTISSDTKKFLLFCFSPLIVIKILFFIISLVRFKLFNPQFWDNDLELIELLYNIILYPIYLLSVNAVLTLKQKRKSSILNILTILICIFTGVIVSYFSWKIIYRISDWEHEMFYFFQLYIFIPLYGIMGIIEHIILLIIFNKRRNKETIQATVQ